MVTWSPRDQCQRTCHFISPILTHCILLVVFPWYTELHLLVPIVCLSMYNISIAHRMGVIIMQWKIQIKLFCVIKFSLSYKTSFWLILITTNNNYLLVIVILHILQFKLFYNPIMGPVNILGLWSNKVIGSDLIYELSSDQSPLTNSDVNTNGMYPPLMWIPMEYTHLWCEYQWNGPLWERMEQQNATGSKLISGSLDPFPGQEYSWAHSLYNTTLDYTKYQLPYHSIRIQDQWMTTQYISALLWWVIAIYTVWKPVLMAWMCPEYIMGKLDVSVTCHTSVHVNSDVANSLSSHCFCNYTKWFSSCAYACTLSNDHIV